MKKYIIQILIIAREHHQKILKNTQNYKCITCTQFCGKMDLKTKLILLKLM
jgi:ribosomal protein S25